MQKEKVNTWNKKVSLSQKYNTSFMQKLLIKGKKEISGSIKISGSKNATLPILAASILAKNITLKNAPFVKDIFKMHRYQLCVILYFVLFIFSMEGQH